MKWVYALVLCGVACTAVAQFRDTSALPAPDTGAFVMHRSPLTATVLSAVVPGAGQFYNDDYLKIPIIWGLGGFLAYNVIKNNNDFLVNQEIYFNSSDSTKRGGAQYFNAKEAARDSRDYYGAFLFLVYVINVLDAYVGAHLFDFPHTGSPASSHVALVPFVNSNSGVGASLRIGFR